MGRPQRWPGGRGERAERGLRPFWGPGGGDKAGQGGWVVGLALENLNSSGWLWALGVVVLP